MGTWHCWGDEKVTQQKLLNVVNTLNASEQLALKMANCTLSKFFLKNCIKTNFIVLVKMYTLELSCGDSGWQYDSIVKMTNLHTFESAIPFLDCAVYAFRVICIQCWQMWLSGKVYAWCAWDLGWGSDTEIKGERRKKGSEEVRTGKIEGLGHRKAGAQIKPQT